MQRFSLPALLLVGVSLSISLLTGCQSTTPELTSSLPTTMTVTSPDGTIEAVVQCRGSLRYSVIVDGKPVIRDAQLGLEFRGGTVMGADVEYVSADRREVDQRWTNTQGGKRRNSRDHCNELMLRLQEADGPRFALAVRAYDNGLALRYQLPKQEGLEEFIMEKELTEFAFTDDHACYFGSQEGGFQGPQEWEFNPGHLSDISVESIVGCPVLVETPGAWVALTESDLLDWAGMWFAGGAEPGTLVTKLAPRKDGQGLVVGETPHRSPWRVLMIGRKPGDLVESDLVLTLATPTKKGWVVPGKMAWDHWWSGETQVDTATIKQYIQLAADMGWPYMLIDWFWYGEPGKPDSDLRTINPDVDMEGIREFAAEKGVVLWLWVRFNDLERFETCEEVFQRFQQWGVVGVKIDFMDRDDQEIVNWYERIISTAADHDLMINFHGAYKPTGLERTYPNYVTREGVLGNEYNKWSTRVTPEHKVTLPFTRLLCGAADYTPGGFLNRQPDKFRAGQPAQVQGTRAAELALFVIYDSPVTCVCDHPDHYRDQPGADFLKHVPTVWAETKVLDAEVADYIVMARQLSKAVWYLGGLTDADERDIEIRLDFLPKAGSQYRWQMQLYKDGPVSDEDAEIIELEERFVTPKDVLKIRMAPSGGFAARIRQVSR